MPREQRVAEIQQDQGPCVECYRSGNARTGIDLTAPAVARDRPRFAPRALATGFVTTHALPLRLRSRVIGTLNLCHGEPPVLAPADIAIAQALADIATIAILQQRNPEQTHTEKSRFQTAPASRILTSRSRAFWPNAGWSRSTQHSTHCAPTPEPVSCGWWNCAGR